jgi:dTDP-4-dehydrorhamnose reductase
MKTIWITGSKGQLGTELLARQSLLKDYQIFATDIAELDLRDSNAVNDFIKKIKPVFIINCAAYTAVDNAEQDQKNAFSINRDVPAILTSAAKLNNSRLIHISTDYVFDGASSHPYLESDATNPQTVYGKSKLDGELEVIKVKDNIVIRTAWLYSAHGNNFVKTMLRLGIEKDEIGVVNDQIGSPTWAGDFAMAVISLIGYSDKVPGGTYHFVNTGICSWYDFALEIMKRAGLPCKVNPLKTSEYPRPAKRPAYSVLSTEKIRNTLNISIPGWKESLQKCLDELN